MGYSWNVLSLRCLFKWSYPIGIWRDMSEFCLKKKKIWARGINLEVTVSVPCASLTQYHGLGYL